MATDDDLTAPQCAYSLLRGDATTNKFANMIKSELVQKLAERDPHLSRHDFEVIVDAILHAIRNGLARGNRVELRGFGTFAVRKHAARIGCNPRTKDPVSVAEKVVPAFRAVKEMHQRLNPTAIRQQNRKVARALNAADSVRYIDV